MQVKNAASDMKSSILNVAQVSRLSTTMQALTSVPLTPGAAGPPRTAASRLSVRLHGPRSEISKQSTHDCTRSNHAQLSFD